MNPTIKLIFSIIAGILTLLTIYGAVKADKKLFLSGICFFSLLPIIGESMGYNADKASVHIIVMLMYVAQFVLAFPTKTQYGSENTAAVKLSGKIGLAILVFNIAGALYVLCLNAGVPHRFGYCHIVFVLAIIYVFVRRMTDKSVWLK